MQALIAVRVQVMPKDNKHYITLFMLADCANDDQPKNLEPHKCKGWDFYSWPELPKPRFVPLDNLVASGFTPFANGATATAASNKSAAV